jgi:glycogen synthase
MRVLMVSRGVVAVGTRSGGAERVCFELSRSLAGEGDEVVLVSDVDQELQALDCRGLRIEAIADESRLSHTIRRCPASFARWLLQHLVGNVRAAQLACDVIDGSDDPPIDVIHSHGALATVLVARRLRRRDIAPPIVYTEHDATPWSCRYRGPVERRIRRCIYRSVNLTACRSATSVVTNFPALADELAERTGLERSHFATVCNGTDRSLFARDARTNQAATWVDRPYCLFVGALVARKGPDLLLRALEHVDVPCVVVGGGPMREELERLAVELGISHRVDFAGSVGPDDVARYVACAAWLTLPSVSEGVPLVAIEALGAGVPVLASDLDGIASIVRDHENGLLLPPGDVDALAAAMRLLSSDPVALAALQRGAVMSAGDILGWSEVADRLRDVYLETLRSSDQVRDARSDATQLAAVISLARSSFTPPWESLEAQQWMRAA